MKVNGKVVAAVLIVLLFVFFVWKPSFVRKMGYDIFEPDQSNAQGRTWSQMRPMSDFSAGGGVSTSLLPREIPSQEDFGNFSPNDILKGQNYLDARAQIGYPETLGGVVRNASWDVRSEPPNPQNPVSIFNNTTIVPDLMRPQFEIGR